MRNENVKKASKLIKERIKEIKKNTQLKKQDPNLKVYQDVVFHDDGWEGW